MRTFFIVLFVTLQFVNAATDDSLTDQELSNSLSIRYAAEFNRVSIGCRSAAMGNSGVVLPYSDFSAFWNPSLISMSKNYRMSFEGAKLYAGMASLGVASVEVPVQNGIYTALQYAAFFPGTILQYDSLPLPFEEMKKHYDINGFSPSGVFHNNKHRVTATIAKLFEIPVPRPGNTALPLPVELGFGLNVKALWEIMDPYNKTRMGMNINLDLGFILRLGVDYDIIAKENIRELLFAFSVNDFLRTKMKWLYSYENYEESVDGRQMFGLAYVDKSKFLNADWTLAIAMERSYDLTFRGGIEALFFDIVSFRAGVDDRVATLGAGIRYKLFSIDYSFAFDQLAFSYLRLTLSAALPSDFWKER